MELHNAEWHLIQFIFVLVEVNGKDKRTMTKGMKGQSNHNLDAKGRLIIPARLREGLGDKFVLCRGMDNNIYAYPEEQRRIKLREFHK